MTPNRMEEATMPADWREIKDQREKYQYYLCSREWAVLKEAVHKRGEGVCERCGQYPIDAVHHLTYARIYAEELEDLAGWCKHCHEYTHGKALWDPREDQTRVPLVDRADMPAPVSDVVLEMLEGLDNRLTGEMPQIPTGFVDLDNLTGGLHKSELVILASRPSMGKTALALNIAEHIAIDAHTAVLFVSMEMSRVELAQRLSCSRGKIDGHKFRSGFLSGSDREALVEASVELSKAPLYIDDSPSRRVAEIGACARRLRDKDLGLVIIDYLQLVQPDSSNDPRQEQVAKISRRLKGLARELAVPVLCLSQLNRQMEAGKEGHRPRLSHLRESGAIEQDADVVMFIHREEYYCTREEALDSGIAGLADVIVAKQRNGPTGEVKLAWFDKFTHFENLSQKPYDEFAEHRAEF
jgi:replicative DNA helicase